MARRTADSTKSVHDRHARRRMRAARLCSTALYAGFTGLITSFFPFGESVSLFSALLAVVAAAAGCIWSLILRHTEHEEPATAYERVAQRYGRRALGEGFTGLGFGLGLLGYQAVLLLMSR